MKRKKIKALISLLMATSILTTACTTGKVTTTPTTTVETTTEETASENSSEADTSDTDTNVVVEYSKKDLDPTFNMDTASKINFDGTVTAVSGEGLTAEGNIVTITAPGTYVVSGTISDGQIIVNAGDEEDVVIVLNGVDLTNTSSAPIYVMNADKTVITLAEGTTNTITDTPNYVFPDAETDEPNAAIFSKDDLAINGAGTLIVNGNYNHGIFSKNDLKITGGIIKVTSVNDAIKGKDFIAVLQADITINAGGDGIQSSNSEDASKGFVLIEGGTFNITAGTDAIQAETSLLIKDGEFTIVTGDGSANSSTSSSTWGSWGGKDGPGETTSTAVDSPSAKGIKAEKVLTIDGGTLKIDSSDDSIHSNQDIIINGGTIEISSGDDGVHADKSLTINAGDLYIAKSYEGLEGGTITINGGDLHVGSMDDGINTSGGNDSSALGGRPGQNGFDSSDGSSLAINGGYLFINADGDGMDSNGDIIMSGGTVIVNGPENNGNGSLDYAGAFTLTGGSLLAAGSSGMAQSVGENSTQNTFLVNLSAIAADTLVHVESSKGADILTFKSGKTISSIVFSSTLLEVGETYTVYQGGSSTGVEKDGIYEGGSYSGGTLLTSFEMTDSITSEGAAGGNMMQPGKGH
ncbi:MAG: carbohydrate-binding domain-containing protein [Clostridiaceae bacterium]